MLSLSRIVTPAFAVAIVLSLSQYSWPAAPAGAQGPEPTPISNRITSSASRSGFYIFLPMVVGAPNSTLSPKGIGLTYNNCQDVDNSKSGWLYGWNASPALCGSTESVPMIWSANNVEAILGGNSAWVMTFNEPDLSGQANMTVTQVAQSWHRIEERFPNRKLLAPVYSQMAYSTPYPSTTHPLVALRQEFYRLYGRYPRFDGLAVHCYMGLATQCEGFIKANFLDRLTEFGASEVWVTEFAFLAYTHGSESASWAQGSELIDWFKTQPKITHYAWFASRIRCYNDEANCEAWANGPPNYPGNTTNSPLFNWADGTPTDYGRGYMAK